MICRSCGTEQPRSADSCSKCGADVAEVTISGITHVPKPSWYLPVTLLILAGVVVGGAAVFMTALSSTKEKPKSVDVTLPPLALPQVAAPEAGWLLGVDGFAKALEARGSNEAPVLVLFCGPKKSCDTVAPVLSDPALQPLLKRVYKVKLDPGHSKEEQAFAAEYKAVTFPELVFLATERSTGLRLPSASAGELIAALDGAVGEAAKELITRGGEELGARKQDRALSTLEAAIALDPRSADAHHWRGLAFEGKGDLKAAAANFKAALERDPAHLSAMEHLGYAYLELGDTKEALVVLDGLVEKAPSYANGRGLHLRASARARAGDQSGARKDLKEACALGTQAACAHAK